MRNSVVAEDLEFITKADVPWDRLEGKNILISGAGGFLPAYLVETILFLNETRFKNKAKVFALVRNLEKATKRFKHYQGRDDLIFIVQDVCQPVHINEDVHYIIHAASHASPKYYGLDPVGTLSANTIGTRNLLELAVAKKIGGFLFFSSGEIYGEVPQEKLPIKEDVYGSLDPLSIRSCYMEGKRAGEAMCAAWWRQYAVPAKIVRIFHTYGPGMDLNDGRVFADFVSDIVNNRDIRMRSDGLTRRPFCYIADATIAFFTVLLKGLSGEAYNVSNDRAEISVADLAHLLVNLCPEKKIKVQKEDLKTEGYVPGKIIRNLPDISKISALGWQPNFSLEQGFSRTVRSFVDE